MGALGVLRFYLVSSKIETFTFIQLLSEIISIKVKERKMFTGILL